LGRRRLRLVGHERYAAEFGEAERKGVSRAADGDRQRATPRRHSAIELPVGGFHLLVQRYGGRAADRIAAERRERHAHDLAERIVGVWYLPEARADGARTRELTLGGSCRGVLPAEVA